MKILSWDVGIIHLSYCLIETDNKENNIIRWGNINLLDNEKKCYGFINSDGTINACCKKPTYTCTNISENYNFCLLHKRQYEKIHFEGIISQNFNNKDICCDAIKSNHEHCKKIAKHKIINNKTKKTKVLCKYHFNLLEKKTNNPIIKKIKNNASKAPIEIIKKNLITILDKNIDFLDVDYVLIENQPSMKNPKMKSVAETLYSWFLIRGLIDKNSIKKIIYMSPSNKIKINNDNIEKEIKKIKDESKRYKYTKHTAIIYTKEILKNNKKWYDFLINNKKKDDLCDSFLQGLYFINNEQKFLK